MRNVLTAEDLDVSYSGSSSDNSLVVADVYLQLTVPLLGGKF